MKRGLKVWSVGVRFALCVPCYNRFPDEKGTESYESASCHQGRGWSYNRFPDEKGTESVCPSRQLPVLSRSYNRFPDEKGTESQAWEMEHLDHERVTTVSPMKRGLKVHFRFISQL